MWTEVGGRKALAAKTETIVRRGQTRALAGLTGPTPAEAAPVAEGRARAGAGRGVTV